MRGATRSLAKRATARFNNNPSTRLKSTVAQASFNNLPHNKDSSFPSVKVTRTSGASSSIEDKTTKVQERNIFATPSIRKEETDLVDFLLQRTSMLVDRNAANVVAYSGGVDSSLVAALVHNVFTNASTVTKNGENRKEANGSKGNARAVLGLSPAVPQEQIQTARLVAQHIGIDLLEIPTSEGTDPTYISNAGEACLACKTHLYSALQSVAENAASCSDNQKRKVILYNGTNADDTHDPTRLGLRAAANFSVESPLVYTTKHDVRLAAKHLGLINWNYAAAPCLRSRLAFGVEATERHLKIVGEAERLVRRALNLDETINMRVRMLAGQRAMIELDGEVYGNGVDVKGVLDSEGFGQLFEEMGFKGNYSVRPFKSGGIATMPSSSRNDDEQQQQNEIQASVA